jgi:uncharacterized protein (TIGR03437 family)
VPEHTIFTRTYGRLLLCAAVLFIGAQTVRAQSILGSNLIVNGGAESGFQYFIDAGSQTTSKLTQDIDVSSAASTISGGNVKYTVSAYLGSATPQGVHGTAQFAVAFENATGQTFSSVTLVSIAAPVDKTALSLQQQIGLVPLGTVRITVTLTLTSATNGGHGAADSLSLVLQTLGTSPAAVLGPNLVNNPGGESGPGAPSSALALYIPGWSTMVGASVAPYGGTGWIGPSDPGPSDRGVNVFWGSGNANVYQDLDVSAAATSIDSGKVTYQVSAWLGAVNSGTTPTLTYSFFDWTGKQLAATAQLGPATHSGTSLALTSHSDILPAGTRRVHIALTFPQFTALADNIAFALSPAGAPVILPSGVVPVYSTSTTIQPGSWASIFGTNLAGTTTSWNGDFPTSLGGTSVTVNSKPAYLWFVSPTQINFQAPDDTATGSVNVVVTTPTASTTASITLGPSGPSFSLFNSKYAAAIVGTPGKPGNSGSGYDYIGPAGGLPFTSRPVKAGETLLLYGVGFGPTNPTVPAGAVFSGAAACVTLPQVTIGGVAATVSFAGIVEAGLYQFNIVVPNAGAGDRLLQAIAGGITTPANVFITLQ